MFDEPFHKKIEKYRKKYEKSSPLEKATLLWKAGLIKEEEIEEVAKKMESYFKAGRRLGKTGFVREALKERK